MSDYFFEIFNKPDDHFVWENHIEFIKRHPEMDDAMKSELIAAFLFFKKEFGNDLIKNQYFNNHPIVSAIQSKAPWLLKWLINLHSSLEFYKETSCNYERILPKLLSATYCTREGIPFIAIADNCRSAGFNIVFEPDVTTNKRPDIEITDVASGEKIYVEVSMQNRSDMRSNNWNVYHTLITQFAFVPPALPFAGKMFQNFSFEQLSGLFPEIHSKKQAAFQNEFIVSFKNELVEFFVSHPNRFSELQALAEEKNYRINDIMSLPLKIDEFERIRSNKLKEEAKQIPQGTYGIIYFIIEPTYRLGYDPMEDILRIQEKLQEFPNIIGVSIQSDWLFNGDEVFIYEADILLCRKMIFNALHRETFFVINRKAASFISSEMFSKIIETFK